MSTLSPIPLHPSTATHEGVLQGLARSGLLQDCKMLWLASAQGGWGAPSGECTLSGTLPLGTHEVQLRVRLPKRFPLCLPDIQVEGIDPHVSLPHMIGGQSICFPEDANLLDSDDPHALAWEALVYARNLLSGMLSGSRGGEFAQEAVAYWQALARGRFIESVVSGGEHPSPLMAFLHEGQLWAVADDANVYAQSQPTRTLDGLTRSDALYLPLGPAMFEQDFHPSELATLGGLRKHIRALPEGDRLRLRMLSGDPQAKEMLLVLGLRRPQGERALLGLRLADIQGGHPFEDEQSQAQCEPIALVRRDLAWLAPRGGAGPDLRNRRVLLVGCGAIGGYIALALARAGVGHLSLVDPESFAPENTYRHACGMARSHEWKVDGLHQEIQRAIPYVSVQPYRMDIQDFLECNSSLVREQNLIISAIGHPTIERHLNQRIWAEQEHPPALFTWLEPLGLGGHALLTHVGNTRGCLNCLYWRPREGGPFKNRAAFAMPDAVYTRDTLGCGSRYLPFADLDAQRTAELASRLALRMLRGEVTESQLLSWKGERRAFEQAGYSVTPRYEAEPEMGSSTCHHEDCHVCGPR